jgi:hypothetical protein
LRLLLVGGKRLLGLLGVTLLRLTLRGVRRHG